MQIIVIAIVIAAARTVNIMYQAYHSFRCDTKNKVGIWCENEVI